MTKGEVELMHRPGFDDQASIAILPYGFGNQGSTIERSLFSL